MSQRGSRRLRSRRGLIILAVIAITVLIGRIIWVNGVFSSAPLGFSGTCKPVAALPGVEDIAIADDAAFVSVASARGPDTRDGIYLLAGDRLTKLAGAPKDFHPRGIGLYRSPDGSGSTRTPGFRMPAGSTAAFAARSASANGSGRWRSYHGRWSRPTA